MPKTTWIHDASWIVAWDGTNQCQSYLQDADLVFAESTITFVGRNYRGQFDQKVDGRGLLVMPGLINIHSHPSTEPFYRGIREEHGVPEMYMSGLYERSLAFSPDMEARCAGAEVAYCEMLLSGTTTVADLSAIYPGWVDLAARSGLRVYLAPSYASARWFLEDEWQLKYRWDETAGKARFHDAMKMIDEARQHSCGRLSGIISPAQIDTCTADLLRESRDAALERKLPFTTHCAQSVSEFLEMVKRFGKSPVQWANETGILGAGTILGHAIFIDEHSWLHWHGHEDLNTLVETSTSVAHCPSPFARYGQVLEDFGRYRRAGVNLGLGTDVAPHNLIEEMRLAAILARIAAEDIQAVRTGDLFHAGTIGGATALGRADLGRLAPGMKADIVTVDLANPLMTPIRDPLRSLIYTAADRAVRDVYVDGIKVVEQRRVLTLDHVGALERVSDAQRRMEDATPQRDYKRRKALEIVPLSLPLMQ